MAERKLKVLCFCDFYLPGYRAGGPIRTIANMVLNLGDEIDFHIVTRDRDFGSNEPYRGVAIDAWNTVGKAQVFYASPASLSSGALRQLICATPHDVLYLNSFLSPKFTAQTLLLRRLGRLPASPVVLAPRGEFAPSALAIKRGKKRLYLAATGALGLFRDLVWQASSEREVEDIRRVQGARAQRIMVAPDLLAPPGDAPAERLTRAPGPLRLVFLSRVSPMKNLDFLLRTLAKSKADLRLSIHGTRDEPAYWAECEALIAALPPNVRVETSGAVAPEEVASVFAAHDLFVFPTRGENFGHVIFESLAAGTPVLVSDQTPWRADSAGALETLPITEPSPWLAAIERWSALSEAELAARRATAASYARDYLATSPALEQNRTLFRAAARLGRADS